MSASSITRITFLPPISRWTFLNCGAHATEMVRPTSVEPVNETIFTRSSAISGSPTSRPPPVTTLNTPFGSPTSSNASASMITLSGVCEAGLMTTVLPQTSAGIVFHAGIAIGKFHGVTRPATPIGIRTAMLNLFGSSDGVVTPNRRRPSPAIRYARSIASWTSPFVSSSTLPISRVISRAIFSLSRCRMAAAR